MRVLIFIVCLADAFKFCATYIPDRNAVGACLYVHRAELDAECKEAMKQWNPK